MPELPEKRFLVDGALPIVDILNRLRFRNELFFIDLA